MSDETPDKITTDTQSTAVQSTADPAMDSRIVSILEELKHDRESRDQQLEVLVNEIRQGFETVHTNSDQVKSTHQQQLSALTTCMDQAFSQSKDANLQRDQRNEEILSKLSESILLDHKLIQEQAHEQEILQEQKLKNLNKLQEQKTRNIRLIAIPGILVAIFAVIYMFYTVQVMEKAMTSMSADMNKIETSVASMTKTMTVMSDDTRSMATNMSTMSTDTRTINGNLGHVAQDMKMMSRNVSPAMAGMRTMMPWSP